MKEKLLKFVWAVLFLLPVCANATDITFTSSGIIEDGDVYESVYVQNNGTIVDMSGGQITSWLSTSDASTFNMSGGQITGLASHIGNTSTVNILGGSVTSGFVVNSGATLNLKGGTVSGVLKTSPAFPAISSVSVVNINGGTLDFDKFEISGTLNIYRGILNVDDSMVDYYLYPVSINIYGSEFNYNPITQILTGRLLDNNLFTIKGVNTNEYTRFNLIPEPISVLFFGFGLLALRKAKK